MKVFRERFVRAFLKKWRKLNSDVLTSAPYEQVHWFEVEKAIPSDVPKGHMVVYVGKEHRRFVIRVSFLDHPLFQGLLDQAQEEYEFNPDSKLCIPCHENTFLAILRDVGADKQDRKIWLCF